MDCNRWGSGNGIAGGTVTFVTRWPLWARNRRVARTVRAQSGWDPDAALNNDAAFTGGLSAQVVQTSEKFSLSFKR